MKIIFSIFFLLFSHISKSQTQDSLVGDWNFKDIYKSHTLDSTKSSNARAILGELKINLRKDNTYSAFFVEQEEGTWFYDPELKTLNLISEKGEDKVKVIEITFTTLVLELNRGRKVVFAKKLM